MAAYPMTPITPILEYLAEKARECKKMVVTEPEDEICRHHIWWYAQPLQAHEDCHLGQRFCPDEWWKEIGLAGITRGKLRSCNRLQPEFQGPAVGLPTRTEQGELLFAIHSGTGNSRGLYWPPPGIVEDAFYLTAKAFNLTENTKFR